MTTTIHTSPTTYFVRTGKQLTESVFSKGGTASGTFKICSNGVTFILPTGEPFAFLVANRHGERFFVNCSKGDDGRIRYMHGLGSREERLLGIPDMSWGDSRRLAASLWDSIVAHAALIS